jgi:uroporphyrinogen-III synthase
VVRAGQLKGRVVVVTSPGSLADRLRAEGCDVIDAPTIEIVGEMRDVDLAGYDWVAYTSANAVSRVHPTGATRVAAVGPATAAAVAERGAHVDLMPAEAVAEALVAAFPDGPGRVLVPQAERARATLVEGLRAKGWSVDVIDAYTTVSIRPPDAHVARARAADAITFLSASATEAWPTDAVPPVVVCIGPVTAAAAAERGMQVTAVADPHTIDGVVAALAKALA